MDRRGVLRMLGASGILLSSFMRKALAQAGPKPSDVPPLIPLDSPPPGGAPVQDAGPGLPADWRFIAPTQWYKVEDSLPARLSLFSRGTPQIDVGGIIVTRAGKIETGKLDPVSPAIDLPAALADIVLPANEALRLDVLNAGFNPFVDDPLGSDGAPLVGPFKAGGELYQGKTLVPVRFVMAKMLETTQLPGPAMQPLLAALSELVAVHTPAHEFRIGRGLGNRVVFYGTDEANGETVALHHGHIDRLVTELGEQKNFRFIKQMVHFDRAAQGGAPDEIVADGAAGSTHAGGFTAGYDRNGRPIAVKSDWPSNYGALGDNNRTYNAHILAIDYSAGAEDPIPERELKAYRRNADMWDCCAAILVPFADQDPDPKFRDYMYNPLEVYDQASARAVAASLAQLNDKAFLAKHGAFYCAEGQYVVANLGPQEDETGGTLLKKSRYGDTPFGKMIAKFLEAPGYAGMSAEEREKNPSIGWEYLLRTGRENGGIDGTQALILTATDRHGIALDFIDEGIKGWQAFRPKNKEALIAGPMTVATIAWSLLRNYMPREGMAKEIAADIMRAYQQGDASVKSSVKLLIGGADPMTPTGQALVAAVAAKAATGLLLGLLLSEKVQASLLAKSGFNEINNEADKKKVAAAYEEFLGILQNADYSTQGSLDRALKAADAKLGKLSVTRTFYNRVTGQRMPAKTTVMKYAAPTCFGMWAQQPFLAETGCFRYVATAMHVSLRKSPAS